MKHIRLMGDVRPRGRDRWTRLTRTASIVVVLLTGFLAGGCNVRTVTGMIINSPDRKSEAYLQVDHLRTLYLVALVVDFPGSGDKMISIDSTVYLCWQPNGEPNRMRRVIVSPETETHNPLGCNVAPKFSPSGRHVAVVSHACINIVDTTTGKCRRLPGRDLRIDSFAWLTDDEVAFSSRRKVGEDPQPASNRYDVSFLRQRIHNEQVAREVHKLINIPDDHILAHLHEPNYIWRRNGNAFDVLTKKNKLVFRFDVLSSAPVGPQRQQKP